MKDLGSLLGFHIEINQLKRTMRYESCNEEVRDSSADHSWHLALMAMDTIDMFNLDVDPIYSLKLALVHDVCEYQGVHDIDSYHLATGVKTKQDKDDFERKAMEKIRDKFGRNDIYDAWRDYEKQSSPESKFIRAMDKIEALVHLIEVGGSKRDGFGDADHIALYADDAVRNFPKLQPYLKEVKSGLKAMYQEFSLDWKPEYDIA